MAVSTRVHTSKGRAFSQGLLANKDTHAEGTRDRDQGSRFRILACRLSGCRSGLRGKGFRSRDVVGFRVSGGRILDFGCRQDGRSLGIQPRVKITARAGLYLLIAEVTV